MNNEPGGRTNYWERALNRRLSRRTAVRGAAIGAFGAGALALVGCGDDDSSKGTSTAATGSKATAVTAAKVGGKIITTVGDDPTGLDPQTGQGGGDHQFFWTMFDNLVAYNKKGEPDGSISLAQSWEVVDGTRINFKLRPGVTFHDGTPFNAAAVKYNIERVQNESTKSSARAQILPITKIETASDLEVSFILDKPNAALLTILGDRGGAVISPASVEKYGKDTGRNPVGTGAFRFKEWAQGDHITVTKSPNYWGKDAAGTAFPYLDEVRWNVVPDPTVALANLESGTIDILGLSANDYDRIKSDSKYTVEDFTGTGWTGVYANQAFAPIDDIHLRRAIGFAIDKAAAAQAVTLGQSPVGLGPITPASWAYNPKLKGLDFNLAEAQKELAASKSPNGAKIEMITINTSYYTQHAELWKQMLKKINIDLDVKPVTTAELTDRTFVKKNVPLQLAGFSMRADPDGIISETLGSQGFYNPGHLANADLDKLIAQARETYDTNQRKALYDQIQQMAIDQVYDYFVFYGVVHAAAPSKVKNLNTIWGAEGKQRYKQIWLG